MKYRLKTTIILEEDVRSIGENFRYCNIYNVQYKIFIFWRTIVNYKDLNEAKELLNNLNNNKIIICNGVLISNEYPPKPKIFGDKLPDYEYTVSPPTDEINKPKIRTIPECSSPSKNDIIDNLENFDIRLKKQRLHQLKATINLYTLYSKEIPQILIDEYNNLSNE